MFRVEILLMTKQWAQIDAFPNQRSADARALRCNMRGNTVRVADPRRVLYVLQGEE